MHRVASTTMQHIACIGSWPHHHNCGMTKIGNMLPRVGIKPISLPFQASVLNITPPRIPDFTMRPTPTWIWLTWEVSADYYIIICIEWLPETLCRSKLWWSFLLDFLESHQYWRGEVWIGWIQPGRGFPSCWWEHRLFLCSHFLY